MGLVRTSRAGANCSQALNELLFSKFHEESAHVSLSHVCCKLKGWASLLSPANGT